MCGDVQKRITPIQDEVQSFQDQIDSLGKNVETLMTENRIILDWIFKNFGIKLVVEQGEQAHVESHPVIIPSSQLEAPEFAGNQFDNKNHNNDEVASAEHEKFTTETTEENNHQSDPTPIVKSVDISSDKDVRPFHCDVCKKSFKRKFHLKTHLLTHSGQKSHQCGYCGKMFLLSKDLVAHERLHTGERPFACPEPDCLKAFVLKAQLKIHSRVHSGELPYKCLECNRAYRQPNSLRFHKKSHLRNGIIPNNSLHTVPSGTVEHPSNHNNAGRQNQVQTREVQSYSSLHTNRDLLVQYQEESFDSDESF